MSIVLVILMVLSLFKLIECQEANVTVGSLKPRNVSDGQIQRDEINVTVGAMDLEILYNKLQAESKRCSFELQPHYSVSITSTCTKLPKLLNENWQMKNLNIQRTGIIKLAKSSFSNLKELKTLKIERNSLKDIENGAFIGLGKLTNLSLAFNRLSKISNYTFLGLENLVGISLRKNLFTSISEIAESLVPSVLPKLRSADLSMNILREIFESSFEPMRGSSLSELMIARCSLEKVHPGFLKPLKNIRRLNTFANSLSLQNTIDFIKQLGNTSLEAVVLSKLSKGPLNLRTIVSLINNYTNIETYYNIGDRIIDLKRGDLPFTEKLKHLELNKNTMRSIEDGAFDYLPSLETLGLKNNYFNKLPKAIEALKSLKHLYVKTVAKWDNFMSVTEYNFTKNVNLLSVDLSNNGIVKIDDRSFEGAFKLEKLVLVNCKVNKITSGAFEDLGNLKILLLNKNSLVNMDFVSGNVLSNLKSLEFLSVAESSFGDHLKNVPVFEPLKKLKTLNLRRSKLSGISTRTFDGLYHRERGDYAKLEKLVLSGNGIIDWSYPLFSYFLWVTELDMSENKITGESSALLNDINRLAVGQKIDLSKNPFSCSCDSRMAVRWMNSSGMQIVGYNTYQHLSDYKCESSGKPVKYESFDKCDFPLKTTHLLVAFTVTALIIVITLGILVSKYKPQKYISYVWFYLNIKLKSSNHKDNFVYDAFISYSSSDSGWVQRKLLPALENEIGRMKLCVYERDFLPGLEISSCIMDSIHQSRKVILILSNNFLKSQWCQWEMSMAQYILVDTKRDDLLIIKLEELDPRHMSRMLKYLVSTRIYLAWSHNRGEQEMFWMKLKSVLIGASNPIRLPEII